MRAPPAVDFTPPFNFAPNSSTIAVGKVGQAEGGGQPVTFSFFSQSMNAGPRNGPVYAPRKH